MAYLGNKPVNNFVSFAKQDITGNGGTSYSLDYPVTGANDIELYINNVRQEPTEAYSCSGSTLTLTGAVSSTDDVYVIFRGRALQTAQHPSDSALEATSGDFSGDITTNKATVTSQAGLRLKTSAGSADVGNVRHDGSNMSITQVVNNGGLLFYTGTDGTSGFYRFHRASDNATALDINTAGVMTVPHQPMCDVKLNANNNTQNGIWSTNAVITNNGNHWDSNNHRFIAPVDGFYEITLSAYTNYSSSYGYYAIYKNGSNTQTMHWNHAGTVAHTMMGYTRILQLSASDYVDARRPGGGDSYFDVTFMTVRLVG